MSVDEPTHPSTTPPPTLLIQVELQGGMLASLLAEETERLTLAYVPVIKSLTQEVDDLKAELRAGRSAAPVSDV